MTHPHHRDTIFLEEATLLTHEAHPGDQFIMRLQAPKCARSARPGQFVHLTVDPLLPLRRPISIMLASPEEGWIELLYKKVGQGTALLAQRKPGETLSLCSAPSANPSKRRRSARCSSAAAWACRP